MTEQIVIAIITVTGTMASSFAGIVISGKLTEYRLTQLEKKVEKLSSLCERVSAVEQKLDCDRTHRAHYAYHGIEEEVDSPCRMSF